MERKPPPLISFAIFPSEGENPEKHKAGSSDTGKCCTLTAMAIPTSPLMAMVFLHPHEEGKVPARLQQEEASTARTHNNPAVNFW